MNHPFDLGEIFPDEASRAVRLPRRQNGSSAQGLAVTLLADYTVRTGAWLPSAAIVALLAEAGVGPAAARTAISRLARRGVLEGDRHGRHSSYRLTRAAAADLAVGGAWIASYGTDAESWAGWWTLIAFSLPQDEAVRRRALRTRLRWAGFAPLYDALWISPRELTADDRARLAAATRGAFTAFRARHAVPGGLGRDPIEAWDVPAIAGRYEAFIREWGGVSTAGLTGAVAVRARTEVMDAYRRFSTLDPGLPTALLPADWPRPAARRIFTAVYDGLAGAAATHVRTVAAGHAAGPPPEIHANTVADLLAGRYHDVVAARGVTSRKSDVNVHFRAAGVMHG